jgi:hypothetical protein
VNREVVNRNCLAVESESFLNANVYRQQLTILYNFTIYDFTKKRFTIHDSRFTIRAKKIHEMDITSEIREKLADEWLPVIYREKVRSQRTRAYRLNVEMRENTTDIHHTLLGVELKAGNNRLSCPDLSAARYLQVFARLGCQEVAVPYDITKISRLADELESSWQKILLLLDEAAKEKTASVKGRMRSALIKQIRNEIDEIGAGALMPEFKQSTKQRRG